MNTSLSQNTARGILILTVVAGTTYLAWSLSAFLGHRQREQADLSVTATRPARDTAHTYTDDDSESPPTATSHHVLRGGGFDSPTAAASAANSSSPPAEPQIEPQIERRIEPTIRLDARKYTVGWICAIVTEFVAAQQFLDDKYQTPDGLDSLDTNHYAVGTMGTHNVVIAVLPHGEYGISSATGVAKDMLRSFPNVKIGLMVGIGGGAPRHEPGHKHDIRLGDVVVSSPRDGRSGVIHYRFGKEIEGKGFQVTGSLNLPPSVLRTALAGLEADHIQNGHDIRRSIAALVRKNPRLQHFGQPDSGRDRLYRSEVLHSTAPDAFDCESFCARDPTNLVSRQPRADNENDPAIHYGLIASADTLMKNASERDRYAREMNVLCFEMEAAGLMNQFPCLVIRGICDYADTHKNKEWQGYAAMTAAAYAKDLLGKIPPKEVEDQRNIADVLNGR